MEQALERMLKDLALDQLIKSPVGEKLQQAMQIFQTVQNHYVALVEKQDEMGMTGIKATTILTFSILKKIADGKRLLSWMLRIGKILQLLFLNTRL